MLGYEDINTFYPTRAECEARAKEVHETMAEDLFRRGASLKISCVDRKIVEKIKQMSLGRQTFSASEKAK
jgi:predicted RNase H-like HicB family nuclease